MKRRSLLQSIAALLVAGPFARLGLLAQPPPPRLTDANVAALKAIAEVVLPGSTGNADRAAAVDRFVRWIHGYRERADRGHSYGASVLSQPTGPSPAARYPLQFAALDALAVAHGGASFATVPLEQRRAIVESVLDQPQRVTSMPARPNGTSLVADFMGYYFSSEGGYDLAYEAAIRRDSCRGLDGSERAPTAPRKG